MFFLFKFSIAFVISFLILSIPIQNHTIFEILNNQAAPYTNKLFKTAKIKALKEINKGKELGKGLFKNAIPQKTSTSIFKSESDLVRAKLSALKKKNLDEKESDNYNYDERILLENIIKQSSHK